MIYLERIPAAPLSEHVRLIWYTSAREVGYERERVLPNGCLQIIINLDRDFIWEYPGGAVRRAIAPSLVVGARATFEIVDTSDMADLVGIVFQPGAFTCFACDAADRFSERNIALEDLWGGGGRALREQLGEARTPADRLRCAERFLIEAFSPCLRRCNIVRFALSRFEKSPLITTVSEVAKETGWSERHFSQRFREEVGLSPKAWCRLQRFRRALQQLYAGEQVSWAELALDCGYYDQSHFANEFRTFSGIDATSYSALRTRWANHVPAE